MENKYSIVIPIKKYTYFWSKNGGIDERKNTKEHDNIKRFFEISWKTHDKNLIKEDIDCIYFIVQDDEKDYFQSFMIKYIKDVKTQIITDNMLISPKFNFTSHRKQMLLKLLIIKYIKTKLYLILDDDIISIKTFGYNDLFINGKIKYSADPNICTQPEVWKCSRDLLRLDKKTNIYQLKKTIAVTPEILIKSVVNDMINYLLIKYKNSENLFIEMTKVSWTEYTLYWLYLRYVDNKGINYYYKSDILSSYNLFGYEENYKEILQEAFKNKNAYFVIIQSNVYEYTIKTLKKDLRTLTNNL
jgi:hypothetical protein